MALDPNLPRGRTLRDLAAVLLIVVGTVGVLTCAFLAHDLAGWALLSTLCVGAGAALGYER